MSDDTVQLEILEAEKVIRKLASKLQDAADTAEALALSQQAYSEAGEALRSVATLLSKSHDVIAAQREALSAAAEALVSRGNDVINNHSHKLSAATDSLVSGTHDVITQQSEKLSTAAHSLISKGHDVISDQAKQLSAAADSLVSRTNDAMKERSKVLWDTADSLQKTNRQMSNTQEAIAKDGKSWIAAAASINEGMDSLKLSATEGFQSLRESLGRSPRSIASKLDLLETQNSKNINELLALIEIRMDALKQANVFSDLAMSTGIQGATISFKQLDQAVCARANETNEFLRKTTKKGSYLLWVIVGINGLIALGVAVVLTRLFTHWH